MFPPLVLPMLKGAWPTLKGLLLVQSSLFSVTTLTVEHEISQVTCMSDVRALIDRMEDPWPVYRHLLTRANQGDPRVDVVVATMNHYPYYPGSGNDFALDEKAFLRQTANDPRLVDVVWRERDWAWSGDWPASHDDVDPERVNESTCLTRLFDSCATNQYGARGLFIVCFYVPLTGHYELIEGRESEAEIIQNFNENIESLRAELPYLRFDPETRKYVLDEEAMASQTPVDPRLQEWVGRPAGPAPSWEGDIYVGTED